MLGLLGTLQPPAPQLLRPQHMLAPQLLGWTGIQQQVHYLCPLSSALPLRCRYIRITRQPNDCGIASEPIYVDMKLKKD